MELDAPDAAAAWKLPEPGQLRSRGPLLQLEAVSFAYPEQPAPALVVEGGEPNLATVKGNALKPGTPDLAIKKGGPDVAPAAGNAPRPPPARRKAVLSNVTLCVEQVRTCFLHDTAGTTFPSLREGSA